jgi:hypothetical protein
VTDASTKGLLPQLTDVLRALTESHALLLNKIQGVRLAQISAVYPLVEIPREFSSSQANLGTRSIIDAVTSPNIEGPEAVQIHDVESGASSNRIASSEFETSPGPVIAEIDVADHMMTSPLPASVEIAPPHDDLAAAVSVRSPLPPDGREAQRTGPPDAEPENRNYNFFDELDARLAGLGDAESAGDR